MLATICLLAPTVGYMEMCPICLKFCTALNLFYISALAKFHGIWNPFACKDKTMSLFVTSYRKQLPQRVLNPWRCRLQLYQNCLQTCVDEIIVACVKQPGSGDSAVVSSLVIKPTWLGSVYDGQ